VSKLLNHYQPDVLVLRDTCQQKRTARIANLNAAICDIAKNHELTMYAYSRERIQEEFGYAGCEGKHDIAELIVKHIPAFERYLPPPRKPWMSEDPRMGIFDAAALGLVFFQEQEGHSV
jgi:hypothetical protein